MFYLINFDRFKQAAFDFIPSTFRKLTNLEQKVMLVSSVVLAAFAITCFLYRKKFFKAENHTNLQAGAIPASIGLNVKQQNGEIQLDPFKLNDQKGGNSLGKQGDQNKFESAYPLTEGENPGGVSDEEHNSPSPRKGSRSNVLEEFAPLTKENVKNFCASNFTTLASIDDEDSEALEENAASECWRSVASPVALSENARANPMN